MGKTIKGSIKLPKFKSKINKEKNNNNSLKINHKHKSLINKNAKLKNTQLIKYGLYEFDLFFVKYLKSKSLDTQKKAFDYIEEIINDIEDYKINKKDMFFFTKKFSNIKINFAQTNILDDFILPKNDKKDTKIAFLYGNCVNRENNNMLRLVSYQLIDLLVKKKRLELLGYYLRDYLNIKKSIIFNNCKNIIKIYGNKLSSRLYKLHMKYLTLSNNLCL